MDYTDIPKGTVGLTSTKAQMSRDERLALKYAERSRGKPLEEDEKLEQQLETRERMMERKQRAEEKEAKRKAAAEKKADEEAIKKYYEENKKVEEEEK